MTDHIAMEEDTDLLDFIESRKLGFSRGQIVSQIAKADGNNEVESLKNALWYLIKEIERCEGSVQSAKGS